MPLCPSLHRGSGICIWLCLQDLGFIDWVLSPAHSLWFKFSKTSSYSQVNNSQERPRTLSFYALPIPLPLRSSTKLKEHKIPKDAYQVPALFFFHSSQGLGGVSTLKSRCEYTLDPRQENLFCSFQSTFLVSATVFTHQCREEKNLRHLAV